MDGPRFEEVCLPDPTDGWFVCYYARRYYVDQMLMVTEWCEEQFGPEGMNGGDRWSYRSGGELLLRDKDDAFAFRMRWG